MLDATVTALRMIRENSHGESWSAGVAMSCLASLDEQGGPWGACHWHPGQPYTMAMRLCNDDGVVEGERHGEIVAYDCTGGAHRYGEHIFCTSPAHEAHRRPKMPKARLYYCSGFPNYGGIQAIVRAFSPESAARIAADHYYGRPAVVREATQKEIDWHKSFGGAVIGAEDA